MTREEAIQVLANFYVSNKNPKANHLCEAMYIAIRALKSEPKHGRWEFIGATTRGAAIINIYACSECGYEADTTTYCPHCGAKMDLDEVENG